MLVQGCTCGLHGKPLAMSHEAKRRLDSCALNQKPLRLPYKLPKPYISRRGDKAVTIGIGLNCTEGLVFGSDSQITRPGLNKFYDTKLFSDVKDSRTLVLVGADDLTLAKEVWDKLLEYPTESHPETTHIAFETILNEMGRLNNDLPLQLLLGVATADSIGLYGFTRRGINRILNYEVLGMGDSSLVRYLADSLHDPFGTLRESVIAAGYILKKAEHHVDGISGPMNLVVLRYGPSLSVLDSPVVERIYTEVTKNERKAFHDLSTISLTLPF